MNNNLKPENGQLANFAGHINVVIIGSNKDEIKKWPAWPANPAKIKKYICNVIIAEI